MKSTAKTSATTCLVTVLMAVQCLARDSDPVAAALDRWDVPRARAIMAIEAERGATEGREFWSGYAAMLEGDYARAEETLDRCREPAAREMLEVVRATRKVTRDLARASSPSGRFLVLYRPGGDEAMLPYLTDALDRAYETLASWLPAPDAQAIRVEVLPDPGALGMASGLPVADIRTSGTVAVCKFAKIMMVTPAHFAHGYPYADAAAHELVHFFLTSRGGSALPLWFQEATARFLEPTWRGVQAGTMTRSLSNILATGVAQGRLIPFDSLGQSLARLGRMEDSALAYAELGSFAGYLDRTFGRSVFARLAAEMTVLDDRAAFSRVTGRTLENVTSAWARELVERGSGDARRPEYGPWTLLREAENETGLTLNAEESGLLRLGDALMAAGRPRAAAFEYGKVSSRTMRPHPFVALRLARALTESGQSAETLALLDRMALDETEFGRIAGVRGRALVALGRFADAVEPLLSSVRSDPFDPSVHEALARAYVATGAAAMAEQEARLATALPLNR